MVNTFCSLLAVGNNGSATIPCYLAYPAAIQVVRHSSERCTIGLQGNNHAACEDTRRLKNQTQQLKKQVIYEVDG